MTGMMLVFMLLAVVYMVQVQQVATDLRDTKGKIYTALEKEFGRDLKKWDAEILPNLTIRFKNPEALFEVGKEEPKPKFVEILNDFVPRYLEIVERQEFKSSIKEVLIEGHTSPEFGKNKDVDIDKLSLSESQRVHLNNIGLSQDRAWWILAKFLEITKSTAQESLVFKKIHLHELGSADPIFRSDGVSVDEQASRRVEFKIVTNAEERLEEIAAKLSGK